ncbi:class I SAM-dependent methyltransferase [Rhizobiales bacterium TNE-4]|nr:class I SAM-dependent methyltransferase [Rhizobiales bacterium TNE-4]MBV1827825.1 class I SAM-dependent methyltransferase [Rhizobiales bacterium TNE-4]
MTDALDKTALEAAYARWAPIYDYTFDAVMAPGRRAAVAAAEHCGPRILDVGAGTGLEFPLFAPSSNVTAVDLSEIMLRRARDRVLQKQLRAINGVLVMDALRLAFADGTFDATLAPYVITVVPDPEATLDEMWRVTRPGGELVLVNHIGAEAGLLASFERWLARHAPNLGWRPDFPWARIGGWIERKPGARLLERRALQPLGLFSLVRIGKGEA